MIQETIDKTLKFLNGAHYLHNCLVDFLGMFKVAVDHQWLKKDDNVLLFFCHDYDHDFYVVTRIGNEERFFFVNDSFPPILVPENLKFYLGGSDD